jgi:hypothetical protein
MPLSASILRWASVFLEMQGIPFVQRVENDETSLWAGGRGSH